MSWFQGWGGPMTVTVEDEEQRTSDPIPGTYRCDKPNVGKSGEASSNCLGRMFHMKEADDVGPDGYEWRVYKCGFCQRIAYNLDEVNGESE